MGPVGTRTWIEFPSLSEARAKVKSSQILKWRQLPCHPCQLDDSLALTPCFLSEVSFHFPFLSNLGKPSDPYRIGGKPAAANALISWSPASEGFTRIFTRFRFKRTDALGNFLDPHQVTQLEATRRLRLRVQTLVSGFRL